ncbi:MAG: hypothetical protein Q9174_005957, partial [Haloplaca sp. 1 TL-2023]
MPSIIALFLSLLAIASSNPALASPESSLVGKRTPPPSVDAVISVYTDFDFKGQRYDNDV